MVFPSFTTSVNGPYYSTPQLLFVSVSCLVGVFLLAQTRRHREYFLVTDASETHTNISVSNALLIESLLFLLISLGIVVLLAKTLSPTIEEIVISYHLPNTLVGIIMAAVILLPEVIAAIIAVRNNKLQTSLNLA